ncbi:hypothetical protein AAVH_34517, partial [Aphelenchoides avenae]
MKSKGQEKCTFSLSIPHFKQFIEGGEEASTATTTVGGFKWRFAASISQLDDGAFLSAYVDCRRTGRTAWATKASVVFTLANSKGRDVSSYHHFPFFGRAEDDNCYYIAQRIVKLEASICSIPQKNSIHRHPSRRLWLPPKRRACAELQTRCFHDAMSDPRRHDGRTPLESQRYPHRRRSGSPHVAR